MILNAPYATRNVKLQEVAEILYIDEFIKKLTLKLYVRAKVTVYRVISNLDDYSNDKRNFIMKHRLPRKMGIKL